MIFGLKQKLIGGAVFALGILAVLAEVFRRGASHERQETQLESFQKDKEGRDAIREEQAETDGLSSGALIERMRSRDDDWNGL